MLGENGNGRLGDGSMTDSLTPVQVEGGHRFTRIAAGRGYTCGLTRASETLCWGADFVLVGQDGIVSDRLVPEPVPGGNTTFAHLAAGGLAGTCGMTGEGWIFCWGANTELGDGSTTRSAVPVRVATPFELSALLLGRERRVPDPGELRPLRAPVIGVGAPLPRRNGKLPKRPTTASCCLGGCNP